MSATRISTPPGRAARRWRRASAAVMPTYVARLATTGSDTSTTNGNASTPPRSISRLASRRSLGDGEPLISPTSGAQQ